MIAGSSSAAADRALVSRIISQKSFVRELFCRESVPEFPVNLLEGFFHMLFDSPSLFPKVFEFPEMFHPWLLLRCCFQFLLDCLRDELAQRNASFSANGLGTAEQEIGNFEGCLHRPILPYVCGTAKSVTLETRPVC